MKYAHLLDLLTGRPQLALPSYLHTVASVLRNHGASISLPDMKGGEYEASLKPLKHMSLVHSSEQLSRFCLMHDFDEDDTESQVEENPNGALAIIPIMGALSQRQGMLASDSSVSRGYNAIKNDFYMALQDEAVGGISLLLDGPGGAQSGNSELVRWMHEAKQKFNKPVWGLIDESAYSATYNIGAVCDRLVTTRSGGVGSIGCMMAHMDQSEANQSEGVNITYIYSGARKVDGNPNQPLSEEARSEAQQACDFYAGVFREDVALHRPNLNVDQIKSYEAGTFIGAAALEAGLVDAIQSPDDYYNELFEFINRADNTPIVSQSTATEPQPSRELKNMADPVTGSGDSNADQHDRYQAICSHPAASNRMSLALDYAKGELPTTAVVMMLDELGKADAAVATANQEAETLKASQNAEDKSTPAADGLSDNVKSMLGISDGANLSASQTSILNHLAPLLAGPDVPADSHDVLDPALLQLKKNESDPSNIDDLVASYGGAYGVQ